jgi:hypothetical protein
MAIYRAREIEYNVETISLADLLYQYSAPEIISYLSIDTEGAEYEILKEFPFDTYSFLYISVEHNYRPERENIRDLLSKYGYRNILDHVSECDDWFINTDYLSVDDFII